MDALILLAVVLGPPVLGVALRKTRLFWLPGIALIALGFWSFASMTDTHGDVGGIAALGNGIAAIAGVTLCGYGLLCLVVGGFAYRRALRTSDMHAPPVELPPAILVKDLSET
jgi:hypothetical protein